MSHSNTEAVADPGTAMKEWQALAGQWQTLARHWAEWWAHAAASLPAAAGVAPEIGNSGLALPLPPPVWIDPAAAAAVTDR